MLNIFTNHPHSAGETYWQHMRFAFKFSFNLIIAGIACFIHAILPFVFQTKASDTVFKMLNDYAKRMPSASTRIKKLLDDIEKPDKFSVHQKIIRVQQKQSHRKGHKQHHHSHRYG